MHDFRRLSVWQRAREFAAAVDIRVKSFPRSDHGVVSGQLRRSAISIPSNIAEGCGKGSRKETIRFFQIALGSATETESHLIIASDFGYLDAQSRETLLGEIKTIQRMLANLSGNLP
jgi:four helix bundle protein